MTGAEGIEAGFDWSIWEKDFPSRLRKPRIVFCEFLTS